MELLPTGQRFQMIGTTIYALPASIVRLFSVHSTFIVSNSPTFTNSVIVDTSLFDNMVTLSGGFIRCSAVQGATISLQKL